MGEGERQRAGGRGPQGVTVWPSVRAAISSMTDTPGRFMLGNVVWLVVAALAVTAGASYRPASVLTLLVVPTTAGLMRMAAHAARGDLPRLRHLYQGAWHRLWRHLAIGAAQGLVLLIAVVNIGVGMGGDSLLFALVTVVACYAALATVVVAVAVWPLLLDPQRREVRVAALFRLALGVVASRPLRLIIVALVEVGLLAAISQVALLGLVLPSFGALIATAFVLPLADGLEDARQATTPPRPAR